MKNKEEQVLERLRKAILLSEKEIVFSTSLAWEDQVITDIIFRYDLPIRVFTLDTGRLFAETYSVLSATRSHYNKSIAVYFPKSEAVEQLVSTKGPMSFYDSIENRKECCWIRKVEPLNRALEGVDVWITGLRSEQSENRSEIALQEWDETRGIYKFQPLFDWSLEEVRTYLRAYQVPVNVLQDRGYVSLGCQPCTRAIKEGESFRSGRWWWEENSSKECGLHR
jgi:phosphoadenosine phosphosulfate reductase